MLAHNRRRAEVTIIRNINQDVGPFVCEAAGDRRMGCFDTNKNPDAKSAEGHQRIRTAWRKLADDSAYRSRTRYPMGQRHILAKRHQADFIILGDDSTLFIYHYGGIMFGVVQTGLKRIQQD